MARIIDFLGQDVIEKEHLLPSTRNPAALASLYRSLVRILVRAMMCGSLICVLQAWFALGISSLKSHTEEPTSPQNTEPISAVSNVTFDVFPSPAAADEPLNLPLTIDMTEYELHL